MFSYLTILFYLLIYNNIIFSIGFRIIFSNFVSENTA